MTEEMIWSGTSSQWKNFKIFALCGLTCFLIVPIFIALWHFLKVRSHQYELTSERLKITDGIFSKNIEALELYRVKDVSLSQPFSMRIFGLENIRLVTSDHTTPQIDLDHISQKIGLADKIRSCVEKRRDQKGVRELDVDQSIIKP